MDALMTQDDRDRIDSQMRARREHLRHQSPICPIHARETTVTQAFPNPDGTVTYVLACGHQDTHSPR